MRRNHLFIRVAVFMLGLHGAGARAELIYDGDRLTDTATGLVWTRGLLPTSTFIPTTGATVATFEQLVSLVTNLGIDPGANPYPVPAPYSPRIAAFADWYAEWAYVYAGPEPGEACNGPNGGGNCFLGVGMVYRPDAYPLWTWYIVQTISRYGPTFTNPPGGWGEEFVPTLFVAPVPLPAGIWLAASALVLIGMKKRRGYR